MALAVIENAPARLIAMSSFASLVLVAALAVFVYVTISEIVDEQTAYASKINISGQQRMLSQRAAFFATEYTSTHGSPDRNLAQESITRLRENHAFLLSEHYQSLQKQRDSTLSAELSELFFEAPYELDNRIGAYVALVEAAIGEDSARGPENVAALKSQSQQILTLFDRVVKQYELESQQKVSDLTKFQNYIFVAILAFVLFQVFFVVRPLLRVSERLTDRLREDANRDYLTGLYNRRIFRDLANQALTMSIRNHHPVSLALFDVDNFKAINDQHGHAVGDKVIRLVADAILSACRKSDEVFRFGGEEFVLVLPETGREGAERVAEKIRRSIEDLSKSHEDWPCEVTISGGVATVADEAHDLEGLLKVADKALYQAKSHCKNRIVAA